MKPLLFMLILAGAGLFASCEEGENSVPAPSIFGTWNLTNVSGGFAGIDEDFEPGVIQWTFDEQSSTLQVENDYPEEGGALYEGLETGTYSFSLSNINGQPHILIDEGDFGSYILSGTVLKIDQGVAADGFLLTLER